MKKTNVQLNALLSAIKREVFKEEQPLNQAFTEKLQAEILVLAKKHDYLHLISEFAVSGEKSEKFNSLIKKERSLALFRYAQQTAAQEQVYEALEQAEISFIPLKGAVLREYYSQPWVRTSSDLDVLIKEEDLLSAEQALLKVGYKKGEESSHDRSYFSESGVHVELHFSLQEERYRSSKALLSAFSTAKPVEGSKHRLAMDDTLFAFYHVYHMAKHFMNGGCGIKPFVDLIIIENNMNVVVGKLRKWLEEDGLVTFFEQARNLAYVWFLGGEKSLITEQMEDFVVSGGVYGKEEQKAALKQVKAGGKIRRILSRTFIGYKEMCICFPSLRKCPILFPFYQVARWFKLVFGKEKKRIKQTLKVNSSVSKDDRNSTKELIEKLGLN